MVKSIAVTTLWLTTWVASGAPLDVGRLTDFRAAYEAARDEARVRKDCLAWYDFAALPPKRLRFVPRPGKGKLRTVPGRWPDQKAVRIFYGKLLGKAIHIPAEGFTLCFWLKVNDLEKVGRHGYKGTIDFDWYENQLKVFRRHSPAVETIDFSGGMTHFGGDRELCCDFLLAM